MNARELIAALVEDWCSWDIPVAPQPVHADLGAFDPERLDSGAHSDYAEQLARAAERTGVDESILTGVGMVTAPDTGDRFPLVLIVSEFGFLGGSIGRVAGTRVVAALQRATARGLPVLALPASGGTRMQEGTPAFLQMAAITAAVNAHKAAGLPYLAYLRHPTTGGVLASWGSLGHVVWGAPGALIGFLGPKVATTLRGEAFPPGVQQAENLYRHGVLDGVVDVDDLPARVARLLAVWRAEADPLEVPRSWARTSGHPENAWSAVQQSRKPDRPGLDWMLDAVPFAPIVDHGPVQVALVQLGGHAVVMVGTDGPTQRAGEAIDVAALRAARRGIALAAELQLPLLTVIDTHGAQLSVRAEEEGLAAEIAHCLSDFLAAPVPTVSVLAGAGAGGAALALFPADLVIATSDGWLAPLPPEGSAALVYGDPGRAPDLAQAQHIWAVDLHRAGLVDILATGRAQILDYVVEYLDPGPRPRPERRSNR
ncbi:carboxyl transferase domain-containing protein [Gordonia phosphorivorans]|uniref:Acetyl-coenzyme A carboxylase carboxyl transferase subunits beta/alpha n=1 Tax=Gordonia phosphorivorans TaxID=1056982 RepID=A0ABV6HE84_9ACTN